MILSINRSSSNLTVVLDHAGTHPVNHKNAILQRIDISSYDSTEGEKRGGWIAIPRGTAFCNHKWVQPVEVLILFPPLSLYSGEPLTNEFSLREPFPCFPKPALLIGSLRL